jgi:hypothetical protein
VIATEEFVLADDFLCTETDSITAIHIWGSWKYDCLPLNSPKAVDFTISIYADVPDSVSPTGYNTPGDVLWTKAFQSGDFTSRVWASGVPEGFWDPMGEYKFPGDTVCYQYNFAISEEEYFYQSGTEAGRHLITWNGSDAAGNRLPSGVYFYRMTSGGRKASRKMLFLR